MEHITDTEIVERFCILTDWDIEPSNILSVTDNNDGTALLTLDNNHKVLYNYDEDYIANDSDDLMFESIMRESTYRLSDKTDDEKDCVYQIFKDTYEKSVGHSYDRSWFDSHAYGWTFYGDEPDENDVTKPVGGIAVRKQRSGLHCLAGSFGPFKSVMHGFIDMKNDIGNDPIWGVVNPDIKNMLIRGSKGDYVDVPGPIIKALEPVIRHLKRGVKHVGLNGVITFSLPWGDIDKVYICNKAYINWLIDMISDPSNKDKFPIPQTLAKPLLPQLKKLVN